MTRRVTTLLAIGIGMLATAAATAKSAPQAPAPQADASRAAIYADFRKSCAAPLQEFADGARREEKASDATITKFTEQFFESILDPPSYVLNGRRLDVAVYQDLLKDYQSTETAEFRPIMICLLQTRIRQLSNSTPATTPPAGGRRSGGPAPATGANTSPVVNLARPGIAHASNNVANDASKCIQIIGQRDLEASGASTNMTAVIRNGCNYPIDVEYCIEGKDCNPGYSNLWTIGARKDWGIDAKDQTVYYAACRAGAGLGFVDGNSELAKQKLHACK